VTYSFRNRFRLQEGDRLDADVQEIRLVDSDDDGSVTMRAPEREMGVAERGALVSQAGELVVQGSEYVDADTAAAAGRKWRQYLTVALAREHKGIDFGPDDRVIPVADIVYDDEPPMLLQQIGVEAGDRVIVDDYQLLVFPTEPTPKFVNFVMGTPTVRISGWLERFQEKIADVRQRNHQPWSREKQLAYKLVHSALRDLNPETQHIQLVTAIEVVISENDRPRWFIDALEGFIAQVGEWPESQDDVTSGESAKERLISILRENKKESIVRAASEQVSAMLTGSYANRSPGVFFKRVYDMRSRLVHRLRRGQRRPTNDELRNVHSELLRLVLDLLDAYESG
jgi:hypothetical protein